MKNLLRVFSLFAVVMLVFSGCAKPVSKCVSPEDNPAHHYVAGMELIDAGKVNEAGEKFERARYCDAGYGPAYAGLAIVSAMKARAAREESYRKTDVDNAFDMLETAEKKASTNADDFAYHLASMRVNTILKPSRKWVGHVEDDYKNAMKLKVDEKRLLYYEGREAASFFMGNAYL
ncbi:MAG: S-layer homology domain-containing protein, partial [Deltaproteobacteria bacterium]|nr:S-layer homology domain-containing protein [Deltaproteobacteria bacterium]